MAKIDRNIIVYGNDFDLYVDLKRYDKLESEFIAFDISQCTDVRVFLICSKHGELKDLKYEVLYDSTIKVPIDHRLLHIHASYGIVVEGYDENETHWRYELMPSEGFLVIPNTSGLKVEDSVSTIMISGTVGWGISAGDLSQYYTKNETEQYVQGELADYYDKGETDGLLNNKVDTSTLVNDYYNKNTVDNLLDTKADTSDLNNYYDKTETNSLLNQKANVSDLNNKQDTLVSGTNIKTINNQSLLGSGNIDIQGGGGENHDNADEATANALYELNERLSEAEVNIDIIPTEVQVKIDELEANVEQSLDELSSKFDEIDEEFKSTALVIEELHETAQPTLVSGTNIKTINNESILGSGNITISGSGVQSNWNETDTTSLAYIQNKPNLATVATSGSYNDLINTPNLATVATSGDYDDLINKPTIPAAQVQSDYNQSDNTQVDYIKNKPDLSIYAQTSNLATVATSGDYDDLTNKPNLSQYATQTDLAGKQDTLVSGTNIKTINNQSLLGSGNIDIQGGGGENHDNADEATTNALYELNERLSEAEINIDIIPTEVQVKIDELETNVEQSLDELSPKFDEIDEEFKSTALVIEELHETAQPTLVSGTNIKTINNESILGSGNITISGSGVQSNWNETDTTSLAYIQNKPTIPTAQVQSDWTETNTSDPSYIQNKPNLATVATSGSYNDLINTPNLATVATSGDYDDLINKPTIPSTTGMVTSSTNGLKIEVVSALPQNPSNDTIYVIQ